MAKMKLSLAQAVPELNPVCFRRKGGGWLECEWCSQSKLTWSAIWTVATAAHRGPVVWVRGGPTLLGLSASNAFDMDSRSQTKLVKWGVFLLFCVVYLPWHRSDEKLLPALPGEAGWDWTAPDRRAGTLFQHYARWRKVMAAQHTHLNPKLSLARACSMCLGW